MAAASVLPAGVPSRCAPAHGRAGGGLLLALLPYRSRRCAQRAAWPSFGRAVSVHAGGPRGRCAFGAGGLSAAWRLRAVVGFLWLPPRLGGAHRSGALFAW